MHSSSHVFFFVFLCGICNADNLRKFAEVADLKGYKCREDKVVFHTNKTNLLCAGKCFEFPSCLSIVYNTETHHCTGCSSFTGDFDAQQSSSRFYKPVYEYLGCFDNCPRLHSSETTRIIKYSTMTTKLCIDYCLRHDFAYSGTENGFECFCGNNHKYTQFNASLSESECSYNCAGDSSQKCGGACKSSMYRTGV